MSFACTVLIDAGIQAVVLDTHMSIVEGSLGILPRRLMVPTSQRDVAFNLLADAGISVARKA
jgi:hypothetical protein